MANSKKRRGKTDRTKMARFEGYGISYFATKHNITVAKARVLIERIGNDRNKLNAAAAKQKKGRGKYNRPADSIELCPNAPPVEKRTPLYSDCALSSATALSARRLLHHDLCAEEGDIPREAERRGIIVYPSEAAVLIRSQLECGRHFEGDSECHSDSIFLAPHYAA